MYSIKFDIDKYVESRLATVDEENLSVEDYDDLPEKKEVLNVAAGIFLSILALPFHLIFEFYFIYPLNYVKLALESAQLTEVEETTGSAVGFVSRPSGQPFEVSRRFF